MSSQSWLNINCNTVHDDHTCHLILLTHSSPTSNMGDCLCKEALKTPDQSRAQDQNTPRPTKFNFVDKNCLAQAPVDAESNHSVLGTAEEESPANIVQIKYNCKEDDRPH